MIVTAWAFPTMKLITITTLSLLKQLTECSCTVKKQKLKTRDRPPAPHYSEPKTKDRIMEMCITGYSVMDNSIRQPVIHIPTMPKTAESHPSFIFCNY